MSAPPYNHDNVVLWYPDRLPAFPFWGYYTPMSITQQMLLFIGLNFLFFIFETLFPVEFHQPFLERVRNAVFALVFFLVGGSAALWIFEQTAWPLPTRSDRSLLATSGLILLALFLWDFVFYWYHRAEHKISWLWNIHEVHHSDAHLNASSALRHAWIENPLQGVLISGPIVYLLKLNFLETLLFSATLATWLAFIHANVKLHLGALTPLLGGPQVHRIHHSKLEQHRDKNFAAFFPCIDKFFGTYHAPTLDEFPTTGTQNMASNLPWKAILTRPFISWLDK